MSGVAPQIVGTFLQAHHQQHQVSGVRDTEENRKANASREQARISDQAEHSVETADNDTRVHPDATGSGSQGRAFEGESGAAEEQELLEEEATGITTDEDGQTHLDIQA